MLAITIAFANIVLSLLPILLVLLAQKRPRNKNGTYKQKINWVLWTAVIIGIFGAFTAVVKGSHDYHNDQDTENGFSSLLVRANKANDNANKTFDKLNEANDRLNVADKAIKVTINNGVDQIKQTQQVSSGLQSTLQNERRNLNIASSILKGQQSLIDKQQDLLSSQKETVRSQSKLLNLQTAQINNGITALSQLNRTVNPIGTVEVSYLVRLPADRPEFIPFKTKLHEAISKYKSQMQFGVEPTADCPFVLTGEIYSSQRDGKKQFVSTLGITIKPSTDLYNALPTSLTNYPAIIMFWKDRPKNLLTGEAASPPDMVLQVPRTYRPVIEYDIARAQFFLYYVSVKCEASKPTGKILAVPDLMGSFALIKRDFFDEQLYTSPISPISDAEKLCSVFQVSLTIGGTPRIFPIALRNKKYDKSIGFTSSFIFNDTPDEISGRSHLFGE